MTIYTFWGNKNENEDGTSGIRIASGFVPIGGHGDFTDAEYAELSGSHILKSGSLTWSRHDFPWVLPPGVVELPPDNNPPPDTLQFPIDGGSSSTTVFAQTIDGGTSSTTTFDQTVDGGTG